MIVVVPPALSCKCAVDQLCIGLTGRYWFAIVTGIVAPFVVAGLGLAVLARAYVYPEFGAWLVAHLTWLIAAAFVLKVGGGGWVGCRLLRHGLLTRRSAIGLAAAWIAAAAAVMTLAFLLVPPEVYSPLAIGGAAIVMALPLVRLAAAPLALDWNRHR